MNERKSDLPRQSYTPSLHLSLSVKAVSTLVDCQIYKLTSKFSKNHGHRIMVRLVHMLIQILNRTDIILVVRHVWGLVRIRKIRVPQTPSYKITSVDSLWPILHRLSTILNCSVQTFNDLVYEHLHSLADHMGLLSSYSESQCCFFQSTIISVMLFPFQSSWCMRWHPQHPAAGQDGGYSHFNSLTTKDPLELGGQVE